LLPSRTPPVPLLPTGGIWFEHSRPSVPSPATSPPDGDWPIPFAILVAYLGLTQLAKSRPIRRFGLG
jgi:hypothetical protein